MIKVCVQICTCDRPELLHKLLLTLRPQVLDEAAAVVVVDNGKVSSEAVVTQFQSDMTILYCRLAARGLVAARNEALRLALLYAPVFVAFIDDDEFPEPDWLSRLVARLEETGADIANGPVVPEYSVEPPRWAVEGQFFHAAADSYRTSNLIIRSVCLPRDKSHWFDATFNFSGGEDHEFLSRLVMGGARHATAEAAVVREHVPQSRMKRRHIWRRGLRDGVARAQIISLRSKSRSGFALKVALSAGQKLGYAANHLFWTVTTPWRITCAMADVAAAAGMILRASGLRLWFYGG